MNDGNRQLTDHERSLVQWILEHGSTEATALLLQLEHAEVTAWRCYCGCASFNFQIRGKPLPSTPGIHPIAHFVFGEDATLSGIFVFEKEGILSGLEVYGLAGEAPQSLPQPEELRPFDEWSAEQNQTPQRKGSVERTRSFEIVVGAGTLPHGLGY